MKKATLKSHVITTLAAVSTALFFGAERADGALVITVTGQPGSNQLTMTLSGSETFTKSVGSPSESAGGVIKFPDNSELSGSPWLAASFMNTVSPVWDTSFAFTATVAQASTMQMEVETGGSSTTIDFSGVAYLGGNYLLPNHTSGGTYPALPGNTETTITMSGSATFVLENGLTFDDLNLYSASNPNRFFNDLEVLDLQMVVVPEPSSAMLVLAAGALGFVRRRG